MLLRMIGIFIGIFIFIIVFLIIQFGTGIDRELKFVFRIIVVIALGCIVVFLLGAYLIYWIQGKSKMYKAKKKVFINKESISSFSSFTNFFLSIILIISVSLILVMNYCAPPRLNPDLDLKKIETNLGSTYNKLRDNYHYKYFTNSQYAIDSQADNKLNQNVLYKNLLVHKPGSIIIVRISDKNPELELSDETIRFIPGEYLPKNDNLSYVIVAKEDKTKKSIGYFHRRGSSISYERFLTIYYTYIWLIDWKLQKLIYAGRYNEHVDTGTLADLWPPELSTKEFVNELLGIDNKK